MKVIILAVAMLALAGCVSDKRAPAPIQTQDGQPTGHNYPQTAEQCRAQPDSPWCHERR